MEFTELTECPLRDGRIVEWLPTAATKWSDWPRDPRAISFNQEQHLKNMLERRRQCVPTQSWLGQVFRFDLALDERAWAEAVDAWIDRHEVLRTHVAIESDRCTRYTLPRGGVRTRRREPGTRMATRSPRQYIQRVLDNSTSPRHWPAYLFITIDHGDAFTVVFGGDHGLMDGYSVVQVAAELHVLYSAANGSGAALPAVGSYLDFGERERLAALAATAADPAVGVWREFFATATGEPSTGAPGAKTLGTIATVFPLDAGPAAAAQVAQRTLAVHLLDEHQAERVSLFTHELGQGFNAALLAAFAAAANELAQTHDFRTVLPVHTRMHPEWAHAFGWFVGLRPFHLNSEGVTGLRRLIELAGQDLRRCRDGADIPFPRVCELLGRRPRTSFLLSYMDIRSLPAADRWAAWDARCLRSRSYSTDECYFWLVRGPLGVTLSARFPGTASAAREVQQIVARLRALLGEFAEHGDAHLPAVTRAEAAKGAELVW
ncbi:condensation domain-containing protein [Nocardia sp. NPDC051052]|uniref:condensation domain-containing protein n=1 Tax=Nocardia sp. NPDC051052 TaxID=3364322 RepID=UPI0037BD296B